MFGIVCLFIRITNLHQKLKKVRFTGTKSISAISLLTTDQEIILQFSEV